MFTKHPLTVCVSLCLLIASCASSPQAVETDATPFLRLPDTTQAEVINDGIIKPKDTVTVTVFGVDDLSGTFDVSYTGVVKLPLIGEVEAAGYTAISFAEIVEERLEERYLQDADVSVLITPGTQQVVTVEGDVRKPGVFDMDAQMTLLNAIALGGGPADEALNAKVFIFRQMDGERMAAGYELAKIRSGETEDPTIFGNDIVVVDTSGARGIYREFMKAVPLLGLFVRAQTGYGIPSRR